MQIDPNSINDSISKLVLPPFELVLYLPYRQIWKLVGYSRGELLNVISLAPQEETTIEIFTWHRMKRIREEEMTTEQEGTLDVAFTDKDSTETVKEMAKTFDWKFSHDGEVTVPLQYVSLKASHHFEIGEEIKDLNKSTTHKISETVRKASAKIKSSRQTKISETEEVGREERVTRKIKNANMCQTLNLDYFEILATYDITTELLVDQVKLCVLVPNLIRDKIDPNFLLNYEGILRKVILSKSYLDGFTGFDATKKLMIWEKLCEVKCMEPCTCTKPTPSIPSVAAAPTGSHMGGQPAGTFGIQPSGQPKDELKKRVIEAAERLRKSLQDLIGAGISAFCNISYLSSIEGWFKNEEEKKEDDAKWNAAKLQYHRWLFWKWATSENPKFDTAGRTLLQAGETQIVEQELPTPFGQPVKMKYEVKIFLNPEGAASAIEDFLKSIDRNLIENILHTITTPIQLLIKIAEQTINPVGEFAKCVPRLTAVWEIGTDNAGLPQAIDSARNAVAAYRGEQLQAQAPTVPGADEKKKETENVIAQATPPEYTAKEIAEAMVIQKALLSHISSNESYYRQAIWSSLDRQDRFRLLSLLGDIFKYAENEIVGFVGNKAALPYRINNDHMLKRWFKENVLDNEDYLKRGKSTVRVSMPTQGVTMEARLGKCNACEEFIINHRELDLKQKEAEVKSAEERAEQEKLETKRYDNRLKQNPPLLEDPDPNQNQNGLRVTLKQDKT